MRINLDKLKVHCQKAMPAITVITGDEHFAIEQMLKSLIVLAKEQGYTEKQIFHVENAEQWSRAWQSIETQSLFADKKCILLRTTHTAPPKGMLEKIERYCQRPDPATCIILVLPKLKSNQLNQAWLKTIESIGVIAQAWPLSREQLPAWIKTRLHKKGLAITDGALHWLCEQVEGDCSLAAQEIEKLYCLYGLARANPDGAFLLTEEHLSHAVVFNARFDVYALIESCLQGNVERTLTVFNTLKAQHCELVLMNWAITRSLRQLLTLHAVPAAEFARNCTTQGIWPKQQADFRVALQRLSIASCQQLLSACQQLDECIKGILSSDPWRVSQLICLQFAGLPLFPHLAVA